MSSKIAASLMALADSLAGTKDAMEGAVSALHRMELAAGGKRKFKLRVGSTSRPYNYYKDKKKRREMAKQSRKLNRH